MDYENMAQRYIKPIWNERGFNYELPTQEHRHQVFGTYYITLLAAVGCYMLHGVWKAHIRSDCFSVPSMGPRFDEISTTSGKVGEKVITYLLHLRFVHARFEDFRLSFRRRS